MRHRVSLLVIAMLCGGCEDWADDCNITLTCAPPPDAVSSDAGTPACNGTCVTANAPDWQPPLLVWLGTDEASAPMCPARAPIMADYFAPPDVPPCARCECAAPSQGSCTLPATMSANNVACPATDPGTAQTPFDPPDGGWDGGCTANDSIGQGAECDGGPCAASVTIGALTLSEGACSPAMVPVPTTEDNPHGATFARACAGVTQGACASSDSACVPAMPMPDPTLMTGRWGFCIMHDGANDAYTMTCPGPYDSQYVFDISFTDTYDCTECTCGPPQGGSCSSLVTIYTDNMCTMQLASDTVTEAAPVCVTLSPGGPALGSKTASTPVYTAGTCAPDGGMPTGTVQQNGPITFCCLN